MKKSEPHCGRYRHFVYQTGDISPNIKDALKVSVGCIKCFELPFNFLLYEQGEKFKMPNNCCVGGAMKSAKHKITQH